MEDQQNIYIIGNTHLELRESPTFINGVADNNGVGESEAVLENVPETVTAQVSRRVVIHQRMPVWKIFGAATCTLIPAWIVAIIVILNQPSTDSQSINENYNYIDSSSIAHSLPSPIIGECGTLACKESVQELLSSLNTSVNPCDNFYDFACQGWENNNPRPSYEAGWNVFWKLESTSDDFVQRILEQPENASPSLSQAKQVYKSCMDFDRKSNEEYALNQMIKTLEKYGGWPLTQEPGTWNESNFNWMKSVVDLKRLFGQTVLLDIDFFQGSSDDISDNRIWLRQPIASRSSSFQHNVVEYRKFSSINNYKNMIINISREIILAKGDRNINETYLEEKASEIMNVGGEIEILGMIPISGNVKNSLGIYDNVLDTPLYKLQYSLDKYLRFQKNELDLKMLLDTLFANANITISKRERIIVGDVDYILDLASFLSNTKPEALANYLHFQMALSMASMTTSKLKGFVDNLEDYLYGTTGQKPRSKICVAILKKKFPDILGQVYVKSRYPVSSSSEFEFAETRKMFRNIIESLTKLIYFSTNENLDKAFNQRIADGVGLCVGYPDWYYDDAIVEAQYKGLDLHQRSFMKQYLAVNGWATDKHLKSLREPLDTGTDECSWNRFLGNVGAYNQLLFHSVHIPVGIMQYPFFNLDFPNVLRYGRLGTILGHEISHSFRSHGWITNDNDTRTEAAECFVQQYNNFTAIELIDGNVTINGKLTLSENVPDNVGLLTAYKAYKSQTIEKAYRKPAELDTFTDDQLFFIAFAQNFCESNTPESLGRSIRKDVHSPGMFRVLGSLRNSIEFAQTWNCPVGSKMNPPVDDKCSIL